MGEDVHSVDSFLHFSPIISLRMKVWHSVTKANGFEIVDFNIFFYANQILTEDCAEKDRKAIVL